MNTPVDIYGSRVFNDVTMQEKLPSDVYKKLSQTMKEGKALDQDVANAVAHAMKEWAIDHGATHYAHWFQPLTGITSEKHDAFIDPVGNGMAITKFSGKELIQGEPDASSFPSGGLRATFEARGYTAWDPTSYAFIKDEVLCIPTAFSSYTGEALDKKTPLLRSMAAIDEQGRRVLKLFGEEDLGTVTATVGAEQEYFLIPEKSFAARQDLAVCGRTLFGAAPSKGQELEEHYFGAIRPTVNEFMKELDDELWKLGIAAKTKHNEVAPCQHELAPVFCQCNRAIDENLITMEKMRLLASHHGLECLQHEKPFEGINGSGKHDNWSLSAGGVNLFDPGDNPIENLRFLVFLTCVIEAVDEYQELLRMSVATASNDHRLGADEAPPAIVSMFLGDEISAIVDALVTDHESEYTTAVKVSMDLGVDVLPNFLKDNTDRNRTSPFAFTGNTWEFRMPGSQQNLSDCNMVLNTAVAKSLKDFANAMEQVPRQDFEKEAVSYIKKSLAKHRRIIFGGNGYSQEWEEEAARRGLANHRTTAEALPCFVDPKSIDLFCQMGVMSETEVRSRYEVKLEKYNKILNIETRVMKRMACRDYLPAISKYAADVADRITSIKTAVPSADVSHLEEIMQILLNGMKEASGALNALNSLHDEAESIADEQERANFYAEHIIPAMEALRAPIDRLENFVDCKYWPVPTYNEILFY